MTSSHAPSCPSVPSFFSSHRPSCRRNRFVTIALTTATVLFLTPAGARADETAPPAGAEAGGASSPAGASDSARPSFAASGGAFGQARQWVYSISSPDEFPFRLTKTGDGDWDLAFRPALDYFLARNVSVGAGVTLVTNGAFSDIGIGARGGYNVPLTSLISLWIRAGLYYHHMEINNSPGINETVFDLTVPFLFHLVPHFFLGVGPMFHLPVQHTEGTTDATYGLTAIVGGWL